MIYVSHNLHFFAEGKSFVFESKSQSDISCFIFGWLAVAESQVNVCCCAGRERFTCAESSGLSRSALRKIPQTLTGRLWQFDL